MGLLAFDSFTIPDGNSIAGTTADTGQVWSVDLGIPSLGDVISWGGDKVGEKNTGTTGSSGFFALPTPTIPSPDYGIRCNFKAGTPIANSESVGPSVRFQQTVPSATQDYIYVSYSTITGTWHLTVREDSAGYFNLYQSAAFPLTVGQVYLLDIYVAGTSMIVKVDGAVVISVTDSHVASQGNPGIVAPDCRPEYSSTVGWWLEDFLVYDATSVANTSFGIGQARANIQAYGAEFGLYFAGSGTAAGQDFTPVDYGIPTPVIINNPQQGFEYAIPVTPLDLAGFISGDMGNVKLRRGGTASNPTKVVLRGISIQYKKKAT